MALSSFLTSNAPLIRYVLSVVLKVTESVNPAHANGDIIRESMCHDRDNALLP